MSAEHVGCLDAFKLISVLCCNIPLAQYCCWVKEERKKKKMKVLAIKPLKSLSPRNKHLGIGGLHCRHVGGKNKRKFAHIIYIIMEVKTQRRKILLFLSTNMAAMTSHAILQYVHGLQTELELMDLLFFSLFYITVNNEKQLSVKLRCKNYTFWLIGMYHSESLR